ncbi:MAG: HXXEE domain-containing protein [Bacteroidales bacterium]
MSALSILYIVLPILAVSLCHTLEVLFTARRWASHHSASSDEAHQSLVNILFRLSGMNMSALVIAAVVGFLAVLLSTAALFVGGLWTERIWATIFMAYSVCTLINIVRAVTLKGYVPGLVTSIISVPLIAYAAYPLSLVWPWWEMLLFAILGLVLALANLYFAQRLGQRQTSKSTKN